MRHERPDGKQPHLPAAVRHDDGLVVGQRQVGAKTNEIKAFIPLLDTLPSTSPVGPSPPTSCTRNADMPPTCADAAYYLFTVGGNQPNLFATLDDLNWEDTPIGDMSTEHGHGRIERRTLQVLWQIMGYRWTPWRACSGSSVRTSSLGVSTDTFNACGMRALF